MKKQSGISSSRLVSVPAIILWFAGAAASFFMNAALPAGIFLFLGLFMLCAHSWGSTSTKNVSLNASCTPMHLYPGGDIEFHYSFTNDKFLPLPWVELSQELSENGCIVPDEDENSGSIVADGPDGRSFYTKCFSYISGYESVEYSAVWHSKHRGLYRPSALLIRSGDGFSLMHSELVFSEKDAPFAAVWPKRIPVDISSMLLSFAEDQAGCKGLMEDRSLVRGIRSYTAADNRKHINRRMEAKNPDEPMVNIYDSIQPGSILFIFDGESFCRDISENGDALFENTAETAGSIITELYERGISCGLCLPESKNFDAVNIQPDINAPLSEIMYYLAGYTCRSERARHDDGSFKDDYVASHFNAPEMYRCIRNATSVYVFTADPSAFPALPLFENASAKIRIVSAGCSDISPFYSTRPLDFYRRTAN